MCRNVTAQLRMVHREILSTTLSLGVLETKLCAIDTWTG